MINQHFGVHIKGGGGQLFKTETGGGDKENK